jgi:hypothetical protein
MVFVDHQGDSAAWNKIATNLDAVASGTATAGSGHFAYDPDEIREIVKAWNELAADYRASARTSTPMASVTGPGLEYASHKHAEMASGSGRKYMESLQKSAEYCRRQAGKYQKALNTMLGIDDETASSVAKSDQDGGI